MKSKRTSLISKTILLFIVVLTFVQKVHAQSCGAGFNWYIQPGTTVVIFNDTSFVGTGDSIISYDWTFGDGSNGSGPNQVHTYTNVPNQYLVCLKITSQGGCVDSVCQTIFVLPCNLFVTLSVDTVNNIITATATGGSPPYSYLWNNGAVGPVLSGLPPGTYCLTVTDANGCSGMACGTITMGNNCGVTFTYLNNQNCGGGPINLIATAFGNMDSLVWDFGDTTYATGAQVTHQFTYAGAHLVCVYCYYQGAVCSQYCGQIYSQAASTSNICGVVFIDTNGNGAKDSAELFMPNQYVLIYGSGIQCYAYTDSNGYYNFNVPAGTYTINYCPDSTTIYTQTFPADSNLYCGIYSNVTVIAGQTQCGYDFGVQQNAVVVEGLIFSDTNTNGVFDPGEYGIPYQLIHVGMFSAYTNSSGVYSFNLPFGTYTISYAPSGAYASYALTTVSSYTVNATSTGVYGGNNFGLDIPAGSNNLSIDIMPYTTVRPGFPALYNIYVSNVGALPVAADVTMMYDANLIYNYSTPTETSHNAATHTLTWNLPIIAPGTTTGIIVNFTTSLAAVLGTPTFELVTVMPATGIDVDLSNNTDSVHQTITNSWDPNNKLVTRTNNPSSDFQLVSTLSSDQQIDYVINFQNTGSAPAVNISVVDELSANLDENTYQVVSTSHNCSVVRTGNTVNYIFSNINLPDSNSNSAASHGQIKFSVKAKNNLSAGTVLTDLAKIYFDYNQPVITNSTQVTLINPLAIKNLDDATLPSITPNPVNGNSTISYTLNQTSLVTIEVVDRAGRVCEQLINRKQNSGNYSYHWNPTLDNGLYFLRMRVNGTEKILKFSLVK